MATLTIGTASGGFFNFRGANTAPYAMGSSVVIQNTGGDISTTGGYEGIIATSLTIQASGYTTTSTLYGNIWNSSGTSITNSSGTSAASDTSAPFGSKTFNLTDQFFATPQTVYVGYSRSAASPTAWDVVNNDNTTRTGDSSGVSPNNLTSSGTGTVFRRLVGVLTYDLYDAGSISRSVTLPTTLKPAVAFGGINGTHAKTITVDWGNGSADQTESIAALRNFSTTSLTITKTANYNPGTYPVTTTISSTISDVPSLSFSNTVSTVPGAPTSLSATAVSSSQINLSWTAPVYANGLSASGGTNGTVTYQLYRGATLVYNSTGTSFNDTGLSSFTSHSYTVYATNTTGQGPVSNTASATTLSGVPGTPTSFSATAVGEVQIDLSWAAPSNNGGSAITGYQLYRGATLIASPAGTSYSDTGLSPETSFSYSVYAVNANGSSASPATASATTQLGGKANIFNGSIKVAVYPKVWNGSAWTTGQSKVWNGSAWMEGIVAGVPSTPVLSGYNDNSGDAEFTSYAISWTVPANGGSTITGFTLQYSSDNVSFTNSTTGAITFTSTNVGANVGEINYWRVFATNANGNSAVSNTFAAVGP